MIFFISFLKPQGRNALPCMFTQHTGTPTSFIPGPEGKSPSVTQGRSSTQVLPEGTHGSHASSLRRSESQIPNKTENSLQATPFCPPPTVLPTLEQRTSTRGRKTQEVVRFGKLKPEQSNTVRDPLLEMSFQGQRGGCQRRGWGNGERDAPQSVQTSSYKMNKPGDLTNSMVITANNAVSRT